MLHGRPQWLWWRKITCPPGFASIWTLKDLNRYFKWTIFLVHFDVRLIKTTIRNAFLQLNTSKVSMNAVEFDQNVRLRMNTNEKKIGVHDFPVFLTLTSSIWYFFVAEVKGLKYSRTNDYWTRTVALTSCLIISQKNYYFKLPSTTTPTSEVPGVAIAGISGAEWDVCVYDDKTKHLLTCLLVSRLRTSNEDKN